MYRIRGGMNMDSIQKILVKTEEGTEVEANVVTFIKDNETGKDSWRKFRYIFKINKSN